MGGNALKQYQTNRLNAKEYFEFVADFKNKFFDTFGFDPVLIKAYHNKPSFGDADFLIDTSKIDAKFLMDLIRVFDLQKNQYITNGNVYSLGIDNFQVDLILTQHEHMKSSEFYFSYNDFGNLIGRIGHKLGIKISHKGLMLVVRHKSRSDHILKEIVLTNDASIALEILGLDRSRYEAGFDELEDIFNFVASSKYFDPAIYSLDNRNATSRVRDKKRATYNAFLKYVEEKTPIANYNFPEKSELGGYSLRMPYYETEVLTRFPHVKQEVDDLIAEFEFDQKFKEIYNGKIVERETGFTGKRLGAFMSEMKPIFTKELKQKCLEVPHLVELNIAQCFINLGGVNFRTDLENS